MEEMFESRPKKSLLAAVLGAAVMLAGCSGGGGGGSPAATGGGTIGGTAGKGLLLGAKVTAYCGKSSDNDALGSTTTHATTGVYSLALSKTCSKPVEVVVEAAAGAKMLDEIKGEIDVPSGFKLRAFVPSVGAGETISKPITPFTDMAAELIEKSSAGVTAAVAANAETAIIVTVLGGNSAVYNAQPKPVADYASASTEEKQLLTLLTSVSAAATSASGSSDGEKIKTVLSTLAAQAAATVTDVTGSAYTVPSSANATTSPLATINAGLTTLQSSSDVNLAAIKADAESVKTAVTAPAATNTTTAAESGTTAVTSSTGVDAAKKLFTTLRSNLLSIYNNSETGFLQTKSKAMSDDFDNVQGAGINVRSALDSFVYAGRLAENVAENAANLGELVTNTKSGNHYLRYGYTTDDSMVCRHFVTNGSERQLAGKTVCSFDLGDSEPRYAAGSVYPIGWIGKYSVLIVERSAAGAYEYTNFIETDTCTYGDEYSCTLEKGAEQTGSYSASYSENGLTSITLVNAKYVPLVSGATDSTLNISIKRTLTSDVDGGDVSGSVVSGPLSVSLLPGSTMSRTQSTNTDAAKLVVQIKTAGFQYDGSLELSAVGESKESATFTGKVSTLSGATVTEFFNGVLSATVTEQADETKPLSATNFTKGTVTLSGKVANASDVSNITVTLVPRDHARLDASFTYNFGGSYALTAEGVLYDRDLINTPDTWTITSTDGTRLELTHSESDFGTRGSVKDRSGVEIGTITSGKSQVNFKDGTYLQLI